MNYIRDFLAWVWAVLSVWWGWLSGSGIAALVGIGQNFGWWNPGKTTYVGLLAIGFIFSMFMAWRIQYQAANQAVKPRFLVSVKATVHFPQPDHNTLLLISVRVANDGTDSSVCGYRVHYKSDTLDQDLQLVVVANQELKHGDFVFRGKDAINLVTGVLKHGEDRVCDVRTFYFRRGNRT